MVQVLPPPYNLGTAIGQATGQGVQSGLQDALMFHAQQQRLSNTINKIQQANPQIAKNPYLSQVLGLSPLLAHPGGAQLLGEVAPLLQKTALAEAQMNAINAARNAIPPGMQPTQVSPLSAPTNIPSGQPQETPTQLETPWSKYLHPQVSTSPLSTFPQTTAGPTTTPEMSPSQLDAFALDYMSRAAQLGTPATYDQGMAIGQARNEQIRASNDVIRSQQISREDAQKKLTSDIVERAINDRLINTDEWPEGRTIVEKLALQQSGAPNRTEAWENVRTNLRSIQNARSSLLRNYEVPGPLSKAYRKLNGSFKEKEQAIKDMQPNLDVFRKHGLFEDARNVLVNTVGLGPEDAERALFPPSKQEAGVLQSFPKHMIQGRGKELEPRELEVFPGELAKLSPEKFPEFKNQMADFLAKNPGANLLTARGFLNQDKGYAWQDIVKAIDELIQERRFFPNLEQDKQLNVIREAPIQGLSNWFKFLWKETK